MVPGAFLSVAHAAGVYGMEKIYKRFLLQAYLEQEQGLVGKR